MTVSSLLCRSSIFVSTCKTKAIKSYRFYDHTFHVKTFSKHMYTERQKSCTTYIFAIFLQIKTFFVILKLSLTYGTRTIRTLVNSALVNSDPILFGPSQFGPWPLVNSDPTTGQFGPFCNGQFGPHQIFFFGQFGPFSLVKSDLISGQFGPFSLVNSGLTSGQFGKFLLVSSDLTSCRFHQSS